MKLHPYYGVLVVLMLFQGGESLVPVSLRTFRRRMIILSDKPTPDHSKADIYSSQDLQNLLDIHETLSTSEPGFLGNKDAQPDDPVDVIPSLHDLVVETIDQVGPEEKPNLLRYESHLEPTELKTIIPRIRAIVSDVDGTLLTSDQTLHPKTASALKEAIECSFSPVHPLRYFFLATGKTRAGALRSLGPEIEALLKQTPGVFCQGLYCVDASGNIVYEQRLDKSAIPRAEAFAKHYELTILGYDGDLLFAGNWTSSHYVNEVTERFGEARPEIVATVMQSHRPGFNKLMFLHDDAEFLTEKVRPKLEALAIELDCEVTQAVPFLLELLPKGCSKALGVKKLCEHLGIDLASEVCSIGDAENDMGLLEQSAIGIAVGNAKQNVKDTADIVTSETNNEGAAGIAIEQFGLGKILEATSGDA